MLDSFLEYAGRYQALRKLRGETHDGLFLPLEALRDHTTDELALSVSFSTADRDTYFTQEATIVRAVKIRLKWFIFPTTESCVLTVAEFTKRFDDLLETAVIDDESFWVIREQHDAAVRSRIAKLELGNSWREKYAHQYFPDADYELQ